MEDDPLPLLELRAGRDGRQVEQAVDHLVEARGASASLYRCSRRYTSAADLNAPSGMPASSRLTPISSISATHRHALLAVAGARSAEASAEGCDRCHSATSASSTPSARGERPDREHERVHALRPRGVRHLQRGRRRGLRAEPLHAELVGAQHLGDHIAAFAREIERGRSTGGRRRADQATVDVGHAAGRDDTGDLATTAR